MKVSQINSEYNAMLRNFHLMLMCMYETVEYLVDLSLKVLSTERFRTLVTFRKQLISRPQHDVGRFCLFQCVSTLAMCLVQIKHLLFVQYHTVKVSLCQHYSWL